MMYKRLRITTLLMLLLLALPAISQAQTTTPGTPAASGPTKVTLIGLSDYHSHAVPFYNEGAQNQAGVARTIAYLKAQRQADPNLLVLSGGDTVNKGSPTWSDEYKCTEWPWFNGLIDAQALGNHEFDYGQAEFQKCQGQASYPTISANYLGADGFPLLQANGKPYFVKQIGNVKIGAFAMAGSDFPRLISRANMAPSSYFGDRLTTARNMVAALRGSEKVDFVVLFGHADRADDAEIARQVPGIDLILGTHSHYKGEFEKVEGTNTYIISPFQYLTYVSRIEVMFDGGKVTDISGKLIKMDDKMPADTARAAEVDGLQKQLEAKYPERFKVLGQAGVELNDAGISLNETVIGNWSMDVVREAAASHVFMSTSSSFRAAIPPGPITVEAFFSAIPYKNSIVTADMTGAQLQALLDLDVSRRNTDSFCQISGVRFKMEAGKAVDVQVLKDPTNPATGFEPLDAAKTYRVGATNFMTGVAAGYKELFAAATNLNDSKIDIGNLLTTTIQTKSPIVATLDGRMGIAPQSQPAQATPGMVATGTPMLATPAMMVSPTADMMLATPAMMMASPTADMMMQPTMMGGGSMPGLPATGTTDNPALWLLLLVAGLLVGGVGVRRRACR